MRKSAFEPCIPTRGTTVPAGNDWIHEIKHDGYRLIVQRDGQRVRLFTRNGHDWSGRFPLITEAALRHRSSSFVLDGEAVLLGVDGISDFNGLHSRKHDDEVMFYAFDILVSDGEDLRKLPLHLRKNNLARLLARRVNGIFLADFEQGEIGPDLFRHACLMGLGGLGIEAQRPALPCWPLSALGQGQEPRASRNGARDGHVLLTTQGDIFNPLAGPLSERTAVPWMGWTK